MRLALLGFGAWGATLGHTFDALGRLSLVHDVSPSACAAAVARFPHVRVAREPTSPWSADIDAVAIATPPGTHAPLVLAALAAGKHVLCEKPLATSLGDALRVRDAARRSKLVVQVGHLLEFAPAVGALRARLAAGACGRVTGYEAERRQPSRHDRPSDALWDLAAHDVGLLMRTFGRAVVRVEARATGASGVVLDLAIADGRRARVVAEFGAAERRRMTTVRGTGGVLLLDELAGSLVEEAASGERVAIPVEPGAPLEFQCRAFEEAIRLGAPPRVDVDYGVDVVRVLHAAERSRALGGAPVTVPGSSARARVRVEPARGAA